MLVIQRAYHCDNRLTQNNDGEQANPLYQMLQVRRTGI
jgi:hypothetical protein